MIFTICLVVLVVAFYATLGRSATPRAERLPVSTWTAKDLLRNVVLGYRRHLELDRRNPMTPHKRTPFHG